ncbi:MAG: S53 family peptidase [Acidimicrobiales bacterium]
MGPRRVVVGRLRRGWRFGAGGTIVLGSALVAIGALAGGSIGQGTAASPVAAARSGVLVHPQVRAFGSSPLSAPPSGQYCLANYGILCYGAPQIETAYDEAPLFREGLDGKGTTIVVLDSFGAPEIRQDLEVFDRAYGLPQPPKFTILKFGHVPAYTPATPTATTWAEETGLDVEWSHAMAPGADILLVETATAETVGLTGFPTIVNAENYVIDHHLGDVISQSFGTGEATFSAPGTILGLQSASVNAYRSGITVLAASGDTGPTEPETVTEVQYFPFRDVGWPASDPLVTAVGGTQLTLDARGRQVAPAKAWNDTELLGAPAASSGGLSTVFTRPSYQDGVAGVVGTRRGVPDISMSASVAGSVDVYLDLPSGGGWLPIGGTSEATPLFAGIVAIADQLNTHHPLGMLDPALYAMQAAHDPGIVNVTKGTTSVYFTTSAKKLTTSVDGFSAGAGYNLATGLGTVTAALFVHELVHAVHRVGTTVTYGDSPGSFLPTT